MTTAFEDSFSRSYAQLEDKMGVDGTYVSPDRSTSTPLIVIPNEQVGALDGFANKTFHLRSEFGPFDRGGFLVVAGVEWDIVDARDAEDGTYELRGQTPIITGS